jgi:hypothetical protein
MVSTGDIKLIATIDTSNYKRGASEIEKANKDIDTSANNADKSSGNLNSSINKAASTALKTGAVAFAALAAAVGAATVQFVGQASQLQSTRASFESLTGSLDTARGIISDLNKFSLETAFSSSDINKSAQTLLGFGVRAEDVLNIMRQLGDVAGATGGDLSSLSLVSGQIFAQGRVQAQDYYQIINSGAGSLAKSLREVVKEQTGINDIKEAFEDGAVTADMFATALDRANDKGGFAFEGAIKQSKTFDGQVSNLVEGINNVGLAIIGVDQTTGDIKVGGIFDTLLKTVSAISEFLKNNKEAIVGFFKAVQDVTDKYVKPFVQELIRVFGEITKNKQVMEGLKVIVIGLGIAIGVLVGLFALAAVGLAAIVFGIAWVIGRIVQIVEDATIAVQNGLNKIVGFFSTAISTIQSLWANIGTWFSERWRDITNAFSNTVTFFRDLWNRVVNSFTDAGRKIGEALGNAFKGAVNGILGFLENRINDIINTINSAIDAIDRVTPGSLSRVSRVSIPRLAEGGLVKARPGGILANIGEGGQDELVIPLDKFEALKKGNGGQATYQINISGVFATSKQEQRRVAEQIAARLEEIQKSRALNGGTV